MPLKPKGTVQAGNVLAGLPAQPGAEEIFDVLVERPGVRIERIVSTGQSTPEGDWYDQDGDEFVLLVAGAARLRIEGEVEDRALEDGDWLFIPAHCRHRVTWTRESPPAVWLAVHC